MKCVTVIEEAAVGDYEIETGIEARTFEITCRGRPSGELALESCTVDCF